MSPMKRRIGYFLDHQSPLSIAVNFPYSVSRPVKFILVSKTDREMIRVKGVWIHCSFLDQ